MVATGSFSYVTVVTTDRANVVLRNARMFRFRPAAVLFRGPRESLGNPSGIWGKISVGGERYWVHRRFHGDIRLANDLVPDAGAPWPARDLFRVSGAITTVTRNKSLA